MINKILFLFFSKKWRIWKSDFLIGSLIWFVIFLLFISITIFSSISIFEDNINLFIWIIVGLHIWIWVLMYSWYCIKRKRLQDLWLTISAFWLSSQFKVFKEWSDKSNDFWTRTPIFNSSKWVKILFWVIIIVLIISIIFILSPLQKLFNSNILVIQSKEIILNDSDIITTFWENYTLWNIWWSLNSSGETGDLSLYYNITWNNIEWKIYLIWHKENWVWIQDDLTLKIWEKEYSFPQ